jgi:hypothetical protein
MAKEVTDAQQRKLVEVLKKSPDESESFYVSKTGISAGQIGPALWKAEPVASPKLKFKANKSEIVKARKDGIRWERIAARTGESIAEVKRIGGKEAADVYTGRGRPTSGYKPNSGGGGSRGAKNKGTSGRRAQSGTSGSKKAPVRRNRTRADRMAAAGDPK